MTTFGRQLSEIEQKVLVFLRTEKPDQKITQILNTFCLKWKPGHNYVEGLPKLGVSDLGKLSVTPAVVNDLIGSVKYSKRYDIVQLAYCLRLGIDNLVITVTPCLDLGDNLTLVFHFTYEDGRQHKIVKDESLSNPATDQNSTADEKITLWLEGLVGLYVKKPESQIATALPV